MEEGPFQNAISKEDCFISINEKGRFQSKTYTENDCDVIFGIGCTLPYDLANSGLFKTIRIGNMIHISRKSFEDWLKAEGWTMKSDNRWMP